MPQPGADVPAVAVVRSVGTGLLAARSAPAGAIVLGSDYRALGVVRSLGRHGIPVCVVASGDDRLAAFSRYARDCCEWPDETEERLSLLDELAQAEEQRWALIPSADESAAFVARHHARLAERLVLTTPPWPVFEWAYDKRRTHDLAREAHVDYPWTMYPSDRAELEAAELRFPLILKPALKPELNRFTAAKAWRCDGLETLLARYDEARRLIDPELLMVQQLVSGGGGAQLSFAALADCGVVRHALTARRTRQYPPDFGRASTFVETVDAPEIEEPSRRLIEASGFTGLLEIEYKVDGDGRPLLLDMNARIWGWQSLCGRAGVDFPWLLWLELQGATRAPVRARTGVRWIRLSTDVPTSLKELGAGRMPARAYLRSLLPPHEGAVFARDDPWPGVLELPLLLRTLARRLSARGA